MKVLVVYCHPLADSYCSALHQTVVRALARQGHEVDDCDLYAEDFNPVLSAAERTVYNDPPHNLLEARPYAQRVLQAQALVLVFPVWNFGLPAMLKGFIDRVLVPGVSFHMEAGGRITPGLTHLRQVHAVTTYGVPRWKAWWLGDAPRATVHRFLRRLTGGQAQVHFHARYHLNRATPHDLQRFMQQVDHAMMELH